jgi:hypothetical protein
MRLFLAVFCLLAATACDEKAATGPTVPINQQFTVAAGEVAVVQDAGVRVQFVRVTGDSRCPADAVCIQGGDAIVHVRVIDSSGTRDHELHTGDSSRATASHRDLRLTLVQLQPYPFSSRPIRDEDYRATLQVSR